MSSPPGPTWLHPIAALLAWWRRPLPPDPWDEETEQQVEQGDAIPVCHRCMTPIEDEGWFCAKCGSAVGPYNNLMPFVYIASMGEVARAGVGLGAPRRWWERVGAMLYGLLNYGFLFPLYAYRAIRSWMRQRERQPKHCGDARRSI